MLKLYKDTIYVSLHIVKTEWGGGGISVGVCGSRAWAGVTETIVTFCDIHFTDTFGIQCIN